MVIRSAKPSRWAPAGQVRVFYDLYLQRTIDADNVLKLLSDAIEGATGINDERMLPCIRSKQAGLSASRARVEIEVDDESIDLLPLPSPVPAASRSLRKPSGSSLPDSPRGPGSSSDEG